MFKLIRYLARKILSVPQWDKKCWGKVWHRFNDDIINESLLIVEQGWQCSIHRHKFRYNAFIMSTATIGIELWNQDKNIALKNGNKEIPADKVYFIRPGECFVVAPNVYHRFYVISPGKLIEIYWTNDDTKCDINDIYRITQGGKRPNAQ